jgi:hypothetical protein
LDQVEDSVLLELYPMIVRKLSIIPHIGVKQFFQVTHVKRQDPTRIKQMQRQRIEREIILLEYLKDHNNLKNTKIQIKE